MTIEVLQEITDWGPNQSGLTETNGIYWVQKGSGHLIAHQPPGGEKKVFKNPIKRFSKSRRKWKKLEEIRE